MLFPWIPRVAIAAGALLAATGVLAGLARMGWNLPLPHRAWLTVVHGPLLVIGFFVTLIGLERAVAVGQRFMLVAPFAAVVGTFALLLGFPKILVTGLLLGALVGFTATFGYLFVVARTVHHLVMFAGALAWLASGFFWSLGWPIPTLVPWWVTGFVLIITGERLELARVLRPLPWIRVWFFSAVAVLLAATALDPLAPEVAARLRGLALLFLASWLLRFDIAWRGVRQHGVHRYSSLSLIQGYGWLAVGGLLLLAFGHQRVGYAYDAQIHAVLLGFVFSQVFAHAPIIFPAVTGLRLRFLRSAYLAPLLLGLSLVVRIGGDLAAQPELRRMGGLLNALALAAFVLTTLLGAVRGRSRAFRSEPSSSRMGATPTERREGDHAHLPRRSTLDS